MNTKTLRRPSDFHSHFRSPAQIGQTAFELVVRKNAVHYRYVVAEPNTYLDATARSRHIETARDVIAYRKLFGKPLQKEAHPSTVLFLIKITPRTTPAIIREAKDAGVVGGKMYPEGVTSGSHIGGVEDFFAPSILASLETMQELDLVFQIHPERPHTFSLDREVRFHDVLTEYVSRFPRLRIFVEHITDRRTLRLVEALHMVAGRVFGTITGHHLRLTLDDVLGNVNNHCWPCAKYPEDRDALVEAALCAPHWLLSITDSAPWKWSAKHPHFIKSATGPAPDNGCGCAGVFNPAEVAIPWLVQRFRGELPEKLESFWACNGVAAYGLIQHADDRITLKDVPWQVPQGYLGGRDRITPFMAAQGLDWQLSE